jgi:hypothetical protein
MANNPAERRGLVNTTDVPCVDMRLINSARKPNVWRFGFAAGVLLLLSLVQLVGAQSLPKVTAVDPGTGKVNDNVTLTGENLGKASVSAVFLSDDKDDFKATLVEQEAGKIILKVPQVKSGGYNISIQEGDKILILPLHFTVQG